MEPAKVRHLHPVPHGGEVPADGPKSFAEALDRIAWLERKLSAAGGTITRLEREQSETEAAWVGQGAIVEVLSYWRTLLCPKALIVADSKGWKTVKKRLSEADAETGRRFTVLELKGAVVGMTLDDWTMDKRFRHRRYLENAFTDAGKVNRHLDRAVGFKNTFDVSGRDIVEELGGDGLRWLAERCSCGGTWLEHLHGGPARDGRYPLERTGCPDMDWFEVRVARYMRDLEQRAAGGDREASWLLEEARREQGAA